MPAKMIIEVRKHLSMGELESRIEEEKNSRMLRRLIFIRNVYGGDDVKEAAARVGVGLTTGYRWLHSWNEGGLEELEPNFGGGRPSKLSDESKEELKKILSGRDDWTTRDVRDLIREEYGVEYSLSHIPKILRSFGMRCGKPYPKDYRRPENADEILKNKMNDVLKKRRDCIIGFIDESNPQTTSSRKKTWSFEKPRIVKNTTYFRANTFGFYSLKGESLVEFKENSKKESICEFFEEIRRENPKEEIVMLLDNFSSHRAKDARKKADELGIELVFLPPYSPDLNPIEQIWKSLKREISFRFVESRERFLKVIQKTFNKLSKKLSFAKGWTKKFLPRNFQKFYH